MPLTKFNRPSLLLSVAAMLILSGLLLAAAHSDDSRKSRLVVYEYAYLTIFEETALLETGDALTASQVREPIAIDLTVRHFGENSTTGNFNALLKALNRFGAQGWKLPPLTELKAGVPMLVRRKWQ
ncbi:MAG: hypothetical protein IBJ18_12245 [Phycisphaerales bacterium]|nr:hypothetical protein [Phycisphaerales bacterium]